MGSYNLHKAQNSYLRLVSANLEERITFDATCAKKNFEIMACSLSDVVLVTIYEDDVPAIRKFIDDFEQSCEKQRARELRRKKSRGKR